MAPTMTTKGLPWLFTLLVLVAGAAAREAPFGEDKTYAPPYGGGSPPTSGDSPSTSGGSPPYYPPSTPSEPSPITPSEPSPTTPSYTPDPTPPTTPAVPTTPYTDPTPTTTPATTTPSTPGTCTWWSSNTSNFPDFISILSTILDLFGTLTGGSGSGSSGVTTAISSIFGGQMTVMQSLTNTRTDGFGALARQGSAALLNSLTRRDYPYNAMQVKTQFRNSLHSQQQAFATARLFENANLALGAPRH